VEKAAGLMIQYPQGDGTCVTIRASEVLTIGEIKAIATAIADSREEWYRKGMERAVNLLKEKCRYSASEGTVTLHYTRGQVIEQLELEIQESRGR